MLHAGVQNQAEQSAKAQEDRARTFGAPMVEIPAKQGPPTTGLVGAIAEREKERKREGGIGAVMTERDRECRQADQELIDARRQSSMGFYPQQQMAFMNPMMFNPYMMGMGQQDPVQLAFQQQAMMAAQQGKLAPFTLKSGSDAS